MEIETAGAPVHTRTLGVTLRRRDPDRIDADAVLLDLRKRGLVPMAGDLQTAGVIHDMRIAACIARDPLRFESLRAEQPSVAFEPTPSTGGESCRDPVRRIDALANTPLDVAAKRLGSALGGPLGCSHVLTLSQWLASSARAALGSGDARTGFGPGERIFQRSLSIDGVQAPDALHLSIQQADVHFAPQPAEALPDPLGPLVARAQPDPLDRLAARHEVRAHAEVDLATMTLRALRAAERRGDREQLYGPWRDRSAPLADLAGGSALGGMAARLFERLGESDPDDALLHALLNLAPALIQCVPAVMERWHAQTGGERPGMLAGGGMTDSCYMWRRGGALQRRLATELAAIRAAE